MIKIPAIITLIGAAALGIAEGDCTAAAVMALLFAPILTKKNARGGLIRSRSNPHAGHKTNKNIISIPQFTDNVKGENAVDCKKAVM